MGLGLGGGERGKDGERATLGAITHLRAIDDGGDVRQRTVMVVVGVMVTLVVVVVVVVTRVPMAVLVLTMGMMVVLMLVCVLGSCFVAVEPGHVVVVVLELLCQLNVKVAGVDAMLVYARTAIEKPSTGSVASCSRRCSSLAPRSSRAATVMSPLIPEVPSMISVC